MTTELDLAVFVCDALRDALGERVTEICVDYPDNYEFYDQTTVIVTEKESVPSDEFADPDTPGNVVYTTTLEIQVMAKDRATAKQIRLDAERAGLAAVLKIVDRDNGPVWAAWQGNKSCGPASLGGVYLGCTGAKREIIVSNSLE